MVRIGHLAWALAVVALAASTAHPAPVGTRARVSRVDRPHRPPTARRRTTRTRPYRSQLAGVIRLMGGQTPTEEWLAPKLAAYPELRDIPEGVIALTRYCSGKGPLSYGGINRALRDGDRSELKRLAPAIRAATEALSRLPPYQGQVYRGVMLGQNREERAAARARYQIGAIITEPSFISTTANLGNEISGAGVTHFIIESRRLGKDISRLSWQEYEREVLFPPGTRFRVLPPAMSRWGRLMEHSIHLEEVVD